MWTHSSPGPIFVRRIEEAVGSAQVLVAVIGRGWMGTTLKATAESIESEGLHFRLEVGRRQPGYPGGPLSSFETLGCQRRMSPEDLGGLARRQALRLEDAMAKPAPTRLGSRPSRGTAEAEMTQQR